MRCSLREGGCGNKYYTKNNTVLQNKTIPKMEQISKKRLLTNRTLNKGELINEIANTMLTYEQYIPVEIFRSKLIELEAIGESRKLSRA